MQQRSDGLIVPHFPAHDRYKHPDGMWKTAEVEKLIEITPGRELSPMDKEALCAIFNNGGMLKDLVWWFRKPLECKGLIEAHINKERPWCYTHVTLTNKGRRAAQEIMKNHVMGVEF